MVPEVMRVKWLFVILTPFQYRMMQRVFGEELHGKYTLIFVAPTVQLALDSGDQRIQSLSFDNFSFSDVRRKPFRKIPEYRRRIGEMREYLTSFLKGIQTAKELNVVIGSEKDNFTQVLLNLLYAQSGPRIYLHAIEEGLGYYVRENWRDRLKAVLYRGLTPLLFGENLSYHKQLGTDSRIDCRYVRLPEMIPEFRGQHLQNVIKIPTEQATQPREISGQKVLVYSFPEGDFTMDETAKGQLLRALFEKLGNREIHVKPHPRESTGVYGQFPGIHVFDQSRPGESIDYFQYAQIVNFASSVIIDILAQGYPVGNIVTIEMRNTGLAFFEETQKVSREDLTDKNFEIKSRL